ncbi:hypothetical protein KDK95_05645 [Actinospica sp. MGRD01-02]|uniref:Uncharacterized protein n=1 Tax=Actinospica acidithermotolerans TaxID=2828514 RepID=A0A941E8D3_9ACTN|nr:hypothetical protein [Actinospica acidithermotolerans]MBR7825783.1 hypothetical protein [Actinospica acidithermotolerans]
MPIEEPEPEFSFIVDGELSPELVSTMLAAMVPEGGRVVELDPPEDDAGMHVFVAVAEGGELSHEDRVSVYNLLLAHQHGSEQ